MDLIYVNFDLMLANDVDFVGLKLSEDDANLYSSQGYVESVQGDAVFSYLKEDSTLWLTRMQESLPIEQDLFSYSATANVAPVTQNQKDSLTSKINSEIFSPNGDLLQYVVNQAKKLRESYSYVSNDEAPKHLDQIGREDLEHVCRHIVVENSLAYEQNGIAHRLVNGDVYIEAEDKKFGHSIVEIQDGENFYFVDPTHIGTQLEKGVSQESIIENIKSQKNRPFYESLRIKGNEYISPVKFKQIFDAAEIVFER